MRNKLQLKNILNMTYLRKSRLFWFFQFYRQIHQNTFDIHKFEPVGPTSLKNPLGAGWGILQWVGSWLPT